MKMCVLCRYVGRYIFLCSPSDASVHIIYILPFPCKHKNVIYRCQNIYHYKVKQRSPEVGVDLVECRV